tara:strand:- start:48 stop:200 length:153 start_codon:yes stop_codon:yes gene_type:complete
MAKDASEKEPKKSAKKTAPKSTPKPASSSEWQEMGFASEAQYNKFKIKFL